MKILVLNSGSSSLKFQLLDMAGQQLLGSGLIEQIGEDQSQATLKYGQQRLERQQTIADHRAAVELMATLLQESGLIGRMAELGAIGHRVVHGGEAFHEPVIIDDDVLATIRALIPLAPLHNPANIVGIEAARQRAPQVPQVAVFDTAFHQSIPTHAYVYGLPYELYEKEHVRRYGFHGTSHHYVAQSAAAYLGQSLQELKLISLHLGNGTSAAAINHGQSVDTSMGMTPLEGLLMGTRSGDVDAAILFYLARETGRTIQELDDLLNKQSGLKGICGQNDMRTIIDMAEQGDEQAHLALTIFFYRLKKYIGSYLAVLNGADAIIFTGGIGENAPLVRLMACAELANLGIKVDMVKNEERSSGIQAIHSDDSQVNILVVPTNEELAIAQQTSALIEQE